MSEHRSSHPSLSQVEALVEFLERNPGLAKGFTKTQSARDHVRRLWEQISMRLNSMGGTLKSAKQWIKYWSDKKCSIKKKAAARYASRNRTGGGPVGDPIVLTEVEERVVALLGGEGFATGDSHLGIHPFEQPLPTQSVEVADNQSPAILHPLNLENMDSMRPNPPSPIIVMDIEDHTDDNAAALSCSSSLSIFSRRRRLFDDSSRATQALVSELVPHTPQHEERGSNSIRTPMMHSQSSPRSQIGPSPYERSPSRRTATASPQQLQSPSQRGATSQVQRSRTSRSTARTSRNSISHALPPSQRRREFAVTVERFLRVEEQQIELQRSNARLMRAVVERSAEREQGLLQALTILAEGMQERDRLSAEALKEGFRALADALRTSSK